jgi:uncharacterized protein
MRIGLISDTHGYFDSRIGNYFDNVDEIWHAGDIGDLSVIEELEKIKPVRAVFGNIDDRIIRQKYPEDLMFSCEGLSVWITHIGGSPPRYNSRVKKILREKAPDIFVCGHSHILSVKRDENFNHMLFVNPGAAGQQGFHAMRTIVRMELQDGKITAMEAVQLGKRGALV